MGVGDSWGTREEFLHPRDSHGRFRKSWKMADDVISRISDFLSKFSPRTFGSDGQAGQYAFNLSQKSPSKFAGGEDLHRLRMDFEHTNHALRLGQTDPSTEKFVKMMEREKIAAPDDMILSRVMTPEAFGLHADTGDQIQELTGKLIADRGYGAARIGTPLGESVPGQPRVLMTIAIPKGTPIMVPGESRDDRRIFLDKGQNLRITKVKPDGQGGYYVLAVAEPGNKATPESMRKLTPSGVTPQQREANIAGAQEITRNRMQGFRRGQEPAPSAVPGSPDAQRTAPPAAPTPQAPAPTPQAPAPTPAPNAPSGPNAPRTETPVSQSIGQGPSAPAVPEAPSASAPAVPEPPAAPTVDLRAEVKAAGIPSPSAGPRRAEWNTAYLGVASGKKHPQDAVRELDADIAKNKALLADDVKTGTDSGPLPADIKAQQQLRDLIAQKYGLEKAPSAPKAEGPKAPSTPKAPTVPKVETPLIPRTEAPVIQVPQEIKNASIPALREAASKAGIRVPASAKTKDQIVSHILTEMVKGEAVRRGIAKPEAPSAPKAPAAASTDVSKMTIPQLRAHAKEQGIKIPSSITRKADIVSHIQSGGKSGAPKSGASATIEDHVRQIGSLKTSGEVGAYLDKHNMTVAQMREVAKGLGPTVSSRGGTKAELRQRIIDGTTGFREQSQVMLPGGWRTSEPSKAPGATATRVTTDEAGKVLKVQHLGAKATSIAKSSPHDQAVRDALGSKSVAEIKRIASDSNIEVPSKIRSKAGAIDHIVNTLNEHQARTGRSSHQNVIKIASETGSSASTPVSKMTVAQLREHAKSQGIKIPSSITKKADIVAHIQSGGKASPARAAEGKGPAINESVSLKGDPEGDNMRMHGDSLTMQLAQQYAKAGRNGSANRMMELRRQATTSSDNGISPQKVIDELRSIRSQETDPVFQRRLDRAIEELDSPKTPIPSLPSDTPPSARKLIEDLNAIPYARKSVRGQPSLVDQLAEVYRNVHSDRTPPQILIGRILRDKVHESNEASFRIWGLEEALRSHKDKDGNSVPSVLDRELRDWRLGKK